MNNPSAYVAPPTTTLSQSMAQAAPYMMVAGAIGSAYGAFASARSAQLQLDLQAELALINARLSESAAQQALLVGQRQEQAQRLKTAQLKGSQRAGLAANGLDLNEGSAKNILDSTDVMGEIDADTIAYNAVRAAWGYRTQGVNSTNAAMMARANAEGISPGGSAAGSLLSNAGSVAYNYSRMSRGVG